jgi:UDP-N-acetylmuramyl pentapeptide synthase
VLATLGALGRSTERGAATLAGFAALEGRGAVFPARIAGHAVTVIDDSYNANPGSMAAALQRLGAADGRRRVAVLGEMLELGPNAGRYHAGLAPLIAGCGVEQVHVVGCLWDGFWRDLPPERRGMRAAGIEAMQAALPGLLRDGDILLLKGSHGSLVHRLAAWLKEDAGAPGGQSYPARASA